MDDKELLTLAAKAAGIDVKWVRNSGAFYYDNEETGHEIFDPLTDDGDALRLAVKLGIEVNFARSLSRTYVNYRFIALYEMHENDPYSATRRAIVRAAAEIGRGM